MMENKHARRISSLFSLGSNSADKGNGTSKSPSSLSLNGLGLTGLAKDPNTVTSPKIPLSPVRIETPSNESSAQNGLSPAQTPQYELGRLAPQPEPVFNSPEPIVTSSELIVTSPELMSNSSQEEFFPPTQALKPLPEPAGSSIGSISESMPANRPRSRTESGADSIANDTDEQQRGSRSRSPSKFLRTSTPLESRLSRRRSWLPGKSRSVSHGGSIVSSTPEAWTLSTHEMEPHDISALVNFQQVSRNIDRGVETRILISVGS